MTVLKEKIIEAQAAEAVLQSESQHLTLGNLRHLLGHQYASLLPI
jgi:hypothetical protein